MYKIVFKNLEFLVLVQRDIFLIFKNKKITTQKIVFKNRDFLVQKKRKAFASLNFNRCKY